MTFNENELRGSGHGDAPVKAEFLKEINREKDESNNNKPSVIVEATVTENKKKRPRDAKVDPSTQLCTGYASGKGCPKEKNLSENSDKPLCKFSHDMKSFIESRPADIDSTCPVFAARGYCPFGIRCRYGSGHIDMTTGTNDTTGISTYTDRSNEQNVVSADLKLSLRKRQYNFLAVNHDGKKNKKKLPKENIQVAEKEPLLLPERKIIDFREKIYIAPLTTVGNLPFRRIVKQYGADITCGEMALTTNLLQGQASEWALLKRHASEDIFGVQIAVAHGDQASRVAEVISRETNVDFIDLNVGCPIDLVCKHGSGSALMNRPKKLDEVVRGALTGIELGSHGKTGSLPALTVKMRTGWNHLKPNAHTLVPALQVLTSDSAFVSKTSRYTLLSENNRQCISALAIHGRSRLMRYSKTADWEYICKSADARVSSNALHLPIIGGGDVLSYHEFHDHLVSNQLDTCMLARGALVKPWICTEIKEKRHWDISSSERFDMLKTFVNNGLEHWGSDQRGVNTTRRFLLEWLSFLCRYVPVGLLEGGHVQKMNERPPAYVGRNELETLMASERASDWVKISEMLLGPVPADFKFAPKHKASAY